MIGQMVWGCANIAIKISILDIFVRLFPTRPVQITCYVLMGLATALCISGFSPLVVCRPLSYTWDKTINGHCGDTQKLYLAQAVTNLIIDIAVMLVPVPYLI